jgi:hypothetical protein
MCGCQGELALFEMVYLQNALDCLCEVPLAQLFQSLKSSAVLCEKAAL